MQCDDMPSALPNKTLKFEISWQLTKVAYCNKNKMWHIQWNGSDFPIDFNWMKNQHLLGFERTTKWIKNNNKSQTKQNKAKRSDTNNKNNNRVSEVTSQAIENTSALYSENIHIWLSLCSAFNSSFLPSPFVCIHFHWIQCFILKTGSHRLVVCCKFRLLILYALV